MRNKSYLPMELVDIEPVRIKKITDEQRDAVCRYSSMEPRVYHQSIKDIRQNPKQQCFEQDPFIAAWNLGVDDNMLTLPARVLPMPEIVYTSQYRIASDPYSEKKGVWDCLKTQFHRPTDFPAVWAMINLTSLDERACKDFYNELSIVAGQRGIKCPPPSIYEERDARHYSIDDIMNLLEDMMSKNGDCKFFLVILPLKTTTISKNAYTALKKKVKSLIMMKK
jgi:hypothetical protein